MSTASVLARRWRRALVSVAILAVASTPGTASAAALPTAPQTFDTTYAAPTGNTIAVNSGGDLQTALNNAQRGDTIVLQAGATFTGPFTLPNKTSGNGWVYVRSSAYGSLPAPGTRVSPGDAGNMPKIVAAASGGTTIRTANNAHHFRFVGIEFRPAAGQFLYNVISIGNGDTSPATLPNNITFDRCYIHGDAGVGSRRGVAMDGVYIAVVDSHVSDFKESGADTQALWAYNTPGPLKIVNNHLEAAGENVMFGGADSKASSMVPSNIEIRGNYFFKPLSWMGSSWTVKNLLEFKSAMKVLVADNRFENNWPAAQTGFSLLITPRNQDGTAPWSGTKDIAIVNNRFINLASAMNISGVDERPSERTQRILIRDNVIQVTGLGGGEGRMFQLLGGPGDVTIDHNTGFGLHGVMMTEALKTTEFVFTNNLLTNGRYGFIGTGTASGFSTLNTYFTNYQLTKNAIIGGNASEYPADNFFPANIAAVGFVNHAGGDYRLAANSPYKNAGTDGKDLGADLGGSGSSTPAPSGPVRPNPPTDLQVD